MTESQLEAKVVAYCNDNRLYTRKFASPAHRGVPDRVIAGKGKVLFLELKQKGKKPTALQERELRLLTAAGQSAWWANNFDDARTMIRSVFAL